MVFQQSRQLYFKYQVSIIPSKINSGEDLILRSSVFNGISRNSTEFRNIIPMASIGIITNLLVFFYLDEKGIKVYI